VVDVTNRWSPVALEASGEPVDPAARLGRGGDGHPAVAPGVDELGERAAQLHRVFLATDATARRGALNELIAAVEPRPAVDGSGQAWFVAHVDALGFAELVAALWDHAATDPDLERLGVCDEDRCVDAYVDRTRANNRRYCSMTCQNRAKVAAFRRRRAAGATDRA
jgi:predicted RNA-binding Zn ribbon-like protein